MSAVRECAWRECNTSLDGMRSHARYCSASCRSAARHHRREETVQKRARLVLEASPPRLRSFAADLALARALRDGVEVTVALRLADVAERDQALTDHVETTHYLDEATGQLYQPKVPPDIPGWGDDDEAQP